MNKSITLIVSVAMSIGFSTAAQADSGDHKEKRAQQMKIMDTNNDQRLSLAESMSFAKKRFNKRDKNGDGFIDKKDFQHRNRKTMFKKMDSNHDGKISLKEFESMKRNTKK